MKISEIYYLSWRMLFRKPFRSVINILIMSLICFFIIVALSFYSFLSEAMELQYNNCIELRAASMNIPAEYDINEVKKTISDLSFISMVTDSSDYKKNVVFEADGNEYEAVLTSGNSDCIPEICCGSRIDFDNSFEIIISQKLYYEMFNTTDFSEKKIKCHVPILDYRETIENGILYIAVNGREINSQIVEFTVKGLYDNEMIFSDDNSCFISYNLAKVLNAADIKDTEHKINPYNEILAITNNYKSTERLSEFAKKNNFACKFTRQTDTKSYKIVIFAIYGATIIFIILGTAVSIFSTEFEYRKNLSDYVMFKAYGYSSKNIIKLFFIKQSILNLLSLFIAAIVTFFFSSRITQIVYSTVGNAPIVFKVSFLSIIFSIAISLISSAFSVLKIYLSLDEITIKDLSNYE